MKNLNRIKGVSIVAAVAIMLLTAIFGVTLAQLSAVSSRGSSNYLRSSQSFGLAQAGLNWQMMQLATTADWDTLTSQTVSLAGWIFNTSLSNWASPQTDSATATRLDLLITGQAIGTSGQNITRTMSQRALKLPSASKFALFWGRRTGSTLTLSSSTISGDFWSQGSSTFSGSSISNGTAYCPSTETITGAASTAVTYNADFGYFGNNQATFSSTFSTPAITSTYYTGLISTYDTLISGCSSGTNINQNTNLTLTGNTICCNNFNTNTNNNTNVTISGNGTIIADQSITLNSTSGTNRVLTISPSGGAIRILAARSLTINATSGVNSVTINSGTRLYSASNSANTQLTTINNNNTNINGALILAKRRIIVQNSANITGSTLFLTYPGDTTNNYLQITGSGTSVGTLVSPCNLISIARASGTPSALTVDTSASVSGLLYQYDTANTGSTRLNSATITGSIIANQFQGNAITSSTITYNPSAIADPPPEGFNNFATKKANTWDGT